MFTRIAFVVSIFAGLFAWLNSYVDVAAKFAELFALLASKL